MITATNTDLKHLVSQGKFRADLFFRLSVVPIHLPALRERLPDIPLLVRYFIERAAQRLGRSRWQISPAAMQLLTRYHWPGNVRELEHAIEQACLWCDETLLLPEHFPSLKPARPSPEAGQSSMPSARISLQRAIRDLERQMIMQALVQRKYVQTRAAAQLGITRRQLRYRMTALGINLQSDGSLEQSGHPVGISPEQTEVDSARPLTSPVESCSPPPASERAE